MGEGIIAVIQAYNIYKTKRAKEEVKVVINDSFNRHQKTVDQKLERNNEVVMQTARNIASFNDKMTQLNSMFDELRKREAEIQQVELGEAVKNVTAIAEQKADTENARRDEEEAVRAHTGAVPGKRR